MRRIRRPRPPNSRTLVGATAATIPTLVLGRPVYAVHQQRVDLTPLRPTSTLWGPSSPSREIPRTWRPCLAGCGPAASRRQRLYRPHRCRRISAGCWREPGCDRGLGCAVAAARRSGHVIRRPSVPVLCSACSNSGSQPQRLDLQRNAGVDCYRAWCSRIVADAEDLGLQAHCVMTRSHIRSLSSARASTEAFPDAPTT